MPNANMQTKLRAFAVNRLNWPLSLSSIVLMSLLLMGATVAFNLVRHRQSVERSVIPDESVLLAVSQVNGLGRLEPQGDIVQLSAPEGHHRLKQWLVEEGADVKAGQTIAVMHGVDQVQAAILNARSNVAVAQANLAKVRAGTDPAQVMAQQSQIQTLQDQLAGDMLVQQTTLARLQTELAQAETDYQRVNTLFESGAVSHMELDNQRLHREQVQRQVQEAQAALMRTQTTGASRIQEAQSTLTSLSEVRDVDVAIAEAELQKAQSALQQAEIELEMLYARSPIDGQLLKVNTNPGETVGAGGLANIGQTQHMHAIAEIHEGDIRHVQIGQQATITSDSNGFSGDLKGQVESIGLQIEKPETVNNSAIGRTDVIWLQVGIKLDPADSDRVKALSRMQVRVAIDI